MAIKVTLGTEKYDVPKMNIGQIEDMSGLDRADPKWVFKALEILLRRAKPAVEDVRDIEAEPDQMGEAITKIMTGSGYKLQDDRPNPTAPDRPGQDS